MLIFGIWEKESKNHTFNKILLYFFKFVLLVALSSGILDVTKDKKCYIHPFHR